MNQQSRNDPCTSTREVREGSSSSTFILDSYVPSHNTSVEVTTFILHYIFIFFPTGTNPTCPSSASSEYLSPVFGCLSVVLDNQPRLSVFRRPTHTLVSSETSWLDPYSRDNERCLMSTSPSVFTETCRNFSGSDRSSRMFREDPIPRVRFRHCLLQMTLTVNQSSV